MGLARGRLADSARLPRHLRLSPRHEGQDLVVKREVARDVNPIDLGQGRSQGVGEDLRGQRV